MKSTSRKEAFQKSKSRPCDLPISQRPNRAELPQGGLGFISGMKGAALPRTCSKRVTLLATYKRALRQVGGLASLDGHASRCLNLGGGIILLIKGLSWRLVG